MANLAEVVDDLRAESDALDSLVCALPEPAWSRPTPAPGWTIAHQIAHLAWTDEVTVLAATDQAAFLAVLSEAQDDPAHLVDNAAAAGVGPTPQLLARWRDGRAALIKVLLAAAPGARIPWFGTTLAPASAATARLMETWAHAQDVADTLADDAGAAGEAAREVRRPTGRLRHVAFLGHRTFAWSFAMHGRAEPTEPVYLELAAPDGGLWTFGPADATNRVTGPALDFCLLVAQRRHPDDLALRATGPAAREWLTIAQVFAGPPGAGRQPRAGQPGYGAP